MVDMVRANGKEITSVLYYLPASGKEEEEAADEIER
jgi:hypothetical protein